MILPSINIENIVDCNSFYFAADCIYFNDFGKPLAKSLKTFAPWANIHVHLFNPTEDQLEWCNANKITYSWETIDVNTPNITTYYACVRFIRIPEIFHPTTKVISLDCDGIAVREIPEGAFLKDTFRSAALWRKKGNTSLASSLFFGPDDFRNTFSNNLKSHFENDSFKWFLDQDVLDLMISKQEVEIVEHRDWGNPKVGSSTFIWTAKGDRKNSKEFQELLDKYKD